MNRKIIILFLSLSSLITYGVGQTIGVDRHGNNGQTDGFFINQFGGECSRPRLNCYGHLLGYPPIVSTDSGSLHGTDHLDLFGTVLSDGWGTVTSRGFQYSNNENFANAIIVAAGNGLGTFQGSITSLSPNQTYYYRGFADNQYGRGYGNTLNIHTEVGNLVLGDLVRGVASDHFDIRIPILDNGGAPVSGRVCAYTDSAHTELFNCQEISPTMGTASTLYFTDAVPGTSYFVEAVVNNTKDTLTVQTQISCPTDLSLRVYQGIPSETRGCDPPEGKDYHFYVSIFGKDPRKEQAEILWNYSYGSGTMNDTNLVVHVEENNNLYVTASIVVGDDTIAAPNTMFLIVNDAIRTQSTCSCCSEEFKNSVSCNGNVVAYTWVNENNDTVANTSSVILPTGDYTLWYTDHYGCSFDKPVYVGPRVRHCVIDGEPRASESAHLEDGVWVLDSIQDHQGNWYIIKQFGSQCWMRQSMRCTHSKANYDFINSNTSFVRATYYENVYDPVGSKQYGLRYTPFAAYDTTFVADLITNLGNNWQGICPVGWHIPSWEECCNLVEYVVHQKDSTLVISPAAVPSNKTICTNLPIGTWLSHTCTANIDEDDWSELTLLRNGSTCPTAGLCTFWLTDNYGSNTFCALRTMPGQYSVIKNTQAINAQAPVRCLRNP